VLVLASASPRRRDLLDAMGVDHEVEPADVDETPLAGESPEALVARLATAKAVEVFCRRVADGAGTDLVVLAADTVVVLDGTVLGKPTGSDDAVEMLRSLTGRTHDVLTGVAVARPGGDGEADLEVVVERTAVTFVELSEAEIDAYVATGEPLDKAGSYGIQGLGGRFVSRVEGSYENVVGLPTTRVADLLGLRHPDG
jgi:septum formation protein